MTPMVYDAVVKPDETKDIGDFAPSAIKEAAAVLERSMGREAAEKLTELETMKRLGIINGSR